MAAEARVAPQPIVATFVPTIFTTPTYRTAVVAISRQRG
jgi:hypothetical protein